MLLDANDEPLSGWLAAFAHRLRPGVGIAHCEPAFSDAAILSDYGFLLPGCYAISREVFSFLGGYDPRHRFAENTDLIERAYVVLCGQRPQDRLQRRGPPRGARRQRPGGYDADRLDAMTNLLDRDAEL